MKIVGIFLSVLVILLNGFPCCWDSCSESGDVEDTQSHSETQTACSPFMSCGSCAGFVLEDEEHDLPALQPDRKEHSVLTNTWVSSDHLDLIWQPPRSINYVIEG